MSFAGADLEAGAALGRGFYGLFHALHPARINTLLTSRFAHEGEIQGVMSTPP